MCLPIIIFHIDFSQDLFFRLRRFFLLGVTVVGLRHFGPVRDASRTTHTAMDVRVNVVPAGPPWHDSHDWGDLLRPSRGPPCCDGEPTWWSSTNDNEDGNWTVQWMGLGNFEWLGWSRVTWERKFFFKLWRWMFFWGTQQKSFWGEFWGGFGGSHFFSPKSGILEVHWKWKTFDLLALVFLVIAEALPDEILEYIILKEDWEDVCCFLNEHNERGIVWNLRVLKITMRWVGLHR